MKKFTEEVKKDLYNYLAIENKNKEDIQDAIKCLEKYFYQYTINWHDDNYNKEWNYGLLFGLCGLNGKRQEATREMFLDSFNISIF